MSSDYMFINSNIETVKSKISSSYRYQSSESFSSDVDSDSEYSNNSPIRYNQPLEDDVDYSDVSSTDSILIDLESAHFPNRSKTYDREPQNHSDTKKLLFENLGNAKNSKSLFSQNEFNFAPNTGRIVSNPDTSTIGKYNDIQKSTKSVRFSQIPNQNIPSKNYLSDEYEKYFNDSLQDDQNNDNAKSHSSDFFSQFSNYNSLSSKSNTDTSNNYNNLNNLNSHFVQDPLISELENELNNQFLQSLNNNISDSLLEKNTAFNSKHIPVKPSESDYIKPNHDASFYDLLKGTSGIFSLPNRFFLNALKPIYSGGFLFRWANLPSLKQSNNNTPQSTNDPKYTLKKRSDALFSTNPGSSNFNSNDYFSHQPNSITNNQYQNYSSQDNTTGSNTSTFLSEPELPNSVFFLPQFRDSSYFPSPNSSDSNTHANMYPQIPVLTSGGKSLQLSKQVTLSKYDKRIFI
ncbi:hypothetical protein AYI69_g6730 [Smittium culicis]|uniref:Uncharacterized protein n=1 Tax=Smittium culicis TaxID=133412 RepID=A0A1R1XXA9_9FUNG|nr:hypothetical protein AYI69_g6730 [Smittium culicis]